MRLLFQLLLLFPFFSIAQTASLPTNDQGKIEYVEVVQTEGVAATQLLSNAKLFITNAFVSSKAVTDLVDDASKTIVAKGLIPIKIESMGKMWSFGDVHAKLTIQGKDGRYKYSITDLEHEYKRSTSSNVSGGSLESDKPLCGTFFMTKKQWDKVKESTNVEIQNLIAVLKNEMLSSKKSDW